MKKIVSIILCFLLLFAMMPTVSAADSAIFEISPNTKEQIPGGTISLKVYISSFDEISSCEFRLSYDTTVFEIVNVYGASGVYSYKDSARLRKTFYKPTMVSRPEFLGTFEVRIKEDAKPGTYYLGGTTEVQDSTNRYVSSYCPNVSIKVVNQLCDHNYNMTEQKEHPHDNIYTCSKCGDQYTSTTGKTVIGCADCEADEEFFYDFTYKDETNHERLDVFDKTSTLEKHNWYGGTITKPATCKETGIKTYTCICKGTKTETIPKLTTHSWGSWSREDVSTHIRLCSVCGAKETDSHSLSGDYLSGETGHWQICTVCDGAGEQKSHIPGDPATEEIPQTCTVCEYVLQPALNHTHTWEDTWESDDQSHWKKCTDCDEKSEDSGEHSYENNCDGTCDVCGYEREIPHEVFDGWLSDEINHWHRCLGCMELMDLTPHTFDGEDGAACIVCDYTPAVDSENPEPTASEIQHVVVPPMTQPTTKTAPTPRQEKDDMTIHWILIGFGVLLLIASSWLLVSQLRKRRKVE